MCFAHTKAPDFRRVREAPERRGERLGDAAEQISTALLTMTRQGGSGNFMIVGAGDDCVQFLGNRGNPEVECELTNVTVEDHCDGRRGKLAWLFQSGFIQAESSLVCRYSIVGKRAAREVAQHIVLLLRSLFGFTPDTRVQIKLVLE